jgi:hypothetical protein
LPAPGALTSGSRSPRSGYSPPGARPRCAGVGGVRGPWFRVWAGPPSEHEFFSYPPPEARVRMVLEALGAAQSRPHGLGSQRPRAPATLGRWVHTHPLGADPFRVGGARADLAGLAGACARLERALSLLSFFSPYRVPSRSALRATLASSIAIAPRGRGGSPVASTNYVRILATAQVSLT